ncbi:MAG: hypothetical protein ABI777_04105, partial [Betaproteobacteria bacterium]
MTTTSTLARKSIAGAMALVMALAPIGPAWAAATLLTDLPIAAKVAAKPNLLYTLDDSGSMLLSHIPDFVMTGPGQSAPNNAGPGYCRHSAGNGTTGCGASFTWGRDVPMFAAEFNKLYYNPDVSYEPPIDGAGNQATYAAPDGLPATTIYKMMTSTKTAAWTAVKLDPYLSGTTSNLITKVNVSVYCNTDWPTANPVNLAAVGDVNGEYSATAGQDCRINGTSYDAIAGAPAVVDDYNYPYNRSTGTVNDPKYFYRNGGNRQIWCKTGAAGWPKTTAGCPYTCTLGGTLTYPVGVIQTCVVGSTAQGAPWTYTPLGCDTNLNYQASGWTPTAPQVPFQ